MVTPVAEPIINKLPPVTAQYARKIQKEPLTINGLKPVRSVGYIPSTAATRATLSSTAESTPVIKANTPVLGIT